MSLDVGTAVRLRVADPRRPGQALGGLWKVTKRLPGGRLHVSRGGKTFNVHVSKVVARNPPAAEVPYEDFRTGLNFRDVRRMLWSNSPDPKNWKHKRRHSVLGLWHGLKGQMYDAYERQNRVGNPGALSVGQAVRLRVQGAPGLWRIAKRLPGGRLQVERGGRALSVHVSKVVAQNPAIPESVARAVRESEEFHWGDKPRMARRIKIALPRPPFWKLGVLPALPYATKKRGERATWEHAFEGKKKPLVLVDSRGELFIHRNGSRYRIRPEGITG